MARNSRGRFKASTPELTALELVQRDRNNRSIPTACRSLRSSARWRIMGARYIREQARSHDILAAWRCIREQARSHDTLCMALRCIREQARSHDTLCMALRCIREQARSHDILAAVALHSRASSLPRHPRDGGAAFASKLAPTTPSRRWRYIREQARSHNARYIREQARYHEAAAPTRPTSTSPSAV